MKGNYTEDLASMTADLEGGTIKNEQFNTWLEQTFPAVGVPLCISNS